MSPFGPDDLDAAEARKNGPKPRPRGKLPYLPDGADHEALCDWLTLAFRPPAGWRISGFERTSRDKADPATLMVRNGRESRAYRFKQQSDLTMRPRPVVVAASDGWLDMPRTSPAPRSRTYGWRHAGLGSCRPNGTSAPKRSSGASN